MSVPVFVNCRDRLGCLEQLVDWLERAQGIREITFIDNDSTFEPLLDYYSASPHKVVNLGRNAGSRALFDNRELLAGLAGGRFVYTDPDVVPDEDCPLDALARFGELLDRYPVATKVGFGLRTDDLPAFYPHRQLAIDWERQFWTEEIEPDVYFAPVDTTFALYRADESFRTVPAIRTGGKFVARHLSWYLDPDNLAADEAHYRARAQTASAEEADFSNWGVSDSPEHLRAHIPNEENHFGSQFFFNSGWFGEGPLVDEQEFTPWATPGFSSWNAMSPEMEISEAVGLVCKLVQPKLTIESGVGQGFTTRRVVAALGDGQTFVGFESDPLWRTLISRQLAELGSPGASISTFASPPDEVLAEADFSILDSMEDYRPSEIARWARLAKPGAIVFVHDTGNGHTEEMVHSAFRREIESNDIKGFFMKNPRGSFIGQKPSAARQDESSEAPSPEAELRLELNRLRQELDELRMTKSYRVMEPLRNMERARRSGGSPTKVLRSFFQSRKRSQ